MTGQDRYGRIQFLFRWLLDSAPARDAMIEATLLTAILHEFVRAEKDPMTPAIQRSCSLILGHLNQPLPLDRLAREARMSKYHFARRFRAETGETPAAYVRSRRIDAAQALLRSTPLPLKAIAEQTGFADEYHFSRAFKRITGTAPGAFRKTAHHP